MPSQPVLVLMAMRTGVRRLHQLQLRRPQLRPKRDQECVVRSPATGVLNRRQCELKMHRSGGELAASMLPTGAVAAAQVRRRARNQMEIPAAAMWSLHQRTVPPEAIGSEAKCRLGQMVRSAGRPERVQEVASPAGILAGALNQRARPNVVRPQASPIGVVASRYHAEARRHHAAKIAGTQGPLPEGAKGCS